MKNIAIKILFACCALLFTQCFEESIQRVSVTPFEEIEAKLKELRDLQRQVNDEDVASTNLQAKIDNLLIQLNELIPPGNVPLTYSIGILSAGSENQLGISGAVVTIHIRDEVITAISNSSGQVKFDDLRSGVALVHIAHPSYTDVSYVVDLLVNRGATTDANNSGEDFNVTSAIGLYPTTAANGALVHTGNLFYDPDRTDDILQNTDPNYGRIGFFDATYNYFNGPFAPAPRLTLTDGVEDANPTVYPFLDARVQSWESLDQQVEIFVGIQPDPFYFSYVPVGTEGNIVIAVYEDMFVRTTSNANGTFTLTLPNATRTLVYSYRLSEFEGEESYFRAENFVTATTTTNFSSRSRDVIYAALYMEVGQADYDYPGGVNNFDETEVNDFQWSWNNTRREVPLNFYYGAKSRNE